MKAKNLFFGALTCLAFAACSNDDEVVNNPESVWNENGEGFITLSLNLPTEPSTRANDVFDDGTEGEYKVNDAILVLFGGSTETESEFQGAYQLTMGSEVLDADNDNITSSYQITKQIAGISGTNGYALVIVNGSNIFSVTTGNGLTIGGVALPASTQFHEFADKVSDLPFYEGDNDFMMLNAPVSSVAGGTAAVAPSSSNITTLAQFSKDRIYQTEAEAKSNPAASIFVERAVAKATVSASNGNTTDNSYSYTISGWTLDNTNSFSHLIRNAVVGTEIGYSSAYFATPKNYRFVGHTQIGETSTQPAVPLYRTYWCEDVNYSSLSSYPLTAKDWSSAAFSAADGVTAEYCKENTFNVANQTLQHTTRAIIKTEFNSGSTFYTINDADAIDTDYKDNIVDFLLKNATFVAWLEENANGVQTFDANDIVLTMDPRDANGVVGLQSFAMSTESATAAKLKGGYTFLDAATVEDIVDLANEFVVVKEFTDGIAYYQVRIKHFGDDLTPWNTWETTDKPSASDSYPGASAEQNYLGRYGMVRNNWYALNVTSIKKIGTPVVPSITTDSTPDDDIDSYISVKINILSWAKRNQNVEL